MWRSATLDEVPAGEFLGREGEPAGAFWVLADGALQISVRDDAGNAVLVARVEAGAIVGGTALLRGGSGRRNATVRAAERSTTLTLGSVHTYYW
jgi:CRP-like cAMP-binding protein